MERTCSDQTNDQGQDDLTVQAADDAFRRRLLALRELFQRDPAIIECFTASTKEERRQGVLHFTATMAFDGGKEMLERAVDYLLDELDHMSTLGHASYVIDVSTGKPIAPVDDRTIYTPPDYVDEGGTLRKARPILNPGMASALGLAKQEQYRALSAIAESKDPGTHEHLKDPKSILRTAKEALETLGIHAAGNGAVEVTLKVGAEQVDGVLQAPNPRFHRAASFGHSLAAQIVKAGYGSCSLVGLRKMADSRSSWYEVTALVTAPKLLTQ